MQLWKQCIPQVNLLRLDTLLSQLYFSIISTFTFVLLLLNILVLFFSDLIVFTHCLGHVDDHVSFKLYEDKAFIAGDCILGCGTAVFDNLRDLMLSLRSIQKLFTQNDEGKNLTCIYPGHGPVLKGI